MSFRHRSLRRGVASGFVSALLAMAGCGIPTDTEPRALPDSDPNTEEDASTTTTAPSTYGADTAFVWYWESISKRLVPVIRKTDTSNTTAIVKTSLAAQTTTEYRQGLTSRIPEGTTLASDPTITNGTLTVDLTNQISQLNAQAQREAFAQIVLTTDQISRVEFVKFEVDGDPLDITNPGGQTQTVTVCDFKELLASTENMKSSGRTPAEIAFLNDESRRLEAKCES